MTVDYSVRVKRLQSAMAEVDVDLVILSVGADLPYFTGYEAMPSERLTVLMVSQNGAPSLFVPRLEAPRVPDGEFDLRAWDERDDPVGLAARMVTRPDRVAVGDHMWSVFLTRFQAVWPSASWLPASQITTELRLIKDAYEVGRLRLAAQAIDRAMARIPKDVPFLGRTERDVARDLAALTVEEGHEVAEFTIVASGANGASPHHHPGERIISSGDLVVCDFGGRLDGYFSDSTRTFSAGEPSQRAHEVHAVVAEANVLGREAAGPGVACQEIDALVRKVVVDAGYGEYFIHRTGHGIGLEVHEHPYIVEGNSRPLAPGMAFSIEPGIYLPGELGVRIEDIVVCTEDGLESLNQSDRTLIGVG